MRRPTRRTWDESNDNEEQQGGLVKKAMTTNETDVGGKRCHKPPNRPTWEEGEVSDDRRGGLRRRAITAATYAENKDLSAMTTTTELVKTGCQYSVKGRNAIRPTVDKEPSMKRNCRRMR